MPRRGSRTNCRGSPALLRNLGSEVSALRPVGRTRVLQSVPSRVQQLGCFPRERCEQSPRRRGCGKQFGQSHSEGALRGRRRSHVKDHCHSSRVRLPVMGSIPVPRTDPQWGASSAARRAGHLLAAFGDSLTSAATPNIGFCPTSEVSGSSTAENVSSSLGAGHGLRRTRRPHRAREHRTVRIS